MADLVKMPKYIEQSDEGLDHLGSEDLFIPRLTIMQALSPGVQDESYTSGQAVNLLTEEVWLEKDKPKEFIPLFHYKEWIKWASRESGQGMLDRSMDPNSPLALSARRMEKNENGDFIATEYHNFIAIFREYGFNMPCIIPCARSNHKHGRKLLGLAKYRGRAPLYAGLYTIQVVQETNSNNQSYYVWKFANAGWINEKEYAAAKEMHGLLASLQWKAAEPVPEVEEEDVEI